mmetsp:Transcript_5052/g.10797  ORF Transcript_5052/g.10797 Transcript_5052/m.10797 type:complete len:80 (-) Transcript_5052:541-780(-)
MVADLEKKSDPTMEIAVDIDPENLRLVRNVTDPAMRRHMKDLIMDLMGVSENEFTPGKSSPSKAPSRYLCFAFWYFSRS